jgi:hypothetical protein
MGRPIRHVELEEAPELDVGLDVGLLAMVAAGAAGTVLLSYLVWRELVGDTEQDRRSRKLLRQLDAARSQLRRQLTAGQDDRANETRIKIADLQRAIMQLEGYI